MLLFSPMIVAKTIAEFTAGMQHQDGFVPFYYDAKEGKIYLTITQFDQQMLFQSSLPQGVGSNDIGLDRGQLGETRLIEFERFGKQVFIKQLNTTFRASSENPAERASIDEAFADSVIAGLPVVAETEGKVLVDYTDFLISDIHGISKRLDDTKQGSFKPDPKRSGVFTPRSKAFPKNTELEALLTFAGSKPGQYVRQVSPDAEIISVHSHHSFIELPDDGYTPRVFHPFSGFWKHSYIDYSAPITADMEQKFIPRHRLEKVDPTAAISEAKDPIVYYLDPGIPEPVMSALREGAQWWDEAFAAIGYKQAFRVEVLPEDADPMDVRYNVIQWVHRATRGWSYGSSVIDPRTGEIIKGHVTLGSLRVRQDYLIALGLTSPFAEGNTDTQPQLDMALARIRQLSAHEVGHTLGIAHNFAASETGRDSVMDYPHPKAEIVNGEISLQNAYATGMGKWDLHTVAYGYQDYASEQTEMEGLAATIEAGYASGIGYKSDPDSRSARHPSADGHLWDNGADAMQELARITAVRAKALSKFGLDSIPDDTPLSALEEYLAPLYFAHRYQVDAVVKLIGGIDYQYEVKSDKPVQGQSMVDADRQRAAIDAILATVRPEFLSIPSDVTQLIIPKVYGSSRSRESFNGRNGLMFDPLSAAEAAAHNSISLLLHPERLNRLNWQHALDDDIPNVSELVDALIDATWKTRIHGSNDLTDEQAKQINMRVRLVTVHNLVSVMQHASLSPENKFMLEGKLRDFTRWLERKDDSFVEKGLLANLKLLWQTGEWRGQFTPVALPPGSPI
ncbi:zinc-dependent metalloprotease [Alteromonas facilis]|uniref:zinc-dependent metalloprotease n=1 Tax=Alteromonas facilis TaxID=2048004 RepID=UPI001F0BFD99|nr:zinc-dependent metalloprotease [Alteromonas facilis]